MESIHTQLVEKSLPIIKAYHDDLLKHDKIELDRYPDRPFLHFTGDTGTHMLTLYLKEDYPAKDEKVPYLFGHADREHIFDQIKAMIKTMPRVNRMELICYYDGTKLHEITYERAVAIVDEYTRKMKVQFKY